MIRYLLTQQNNPDKIVVINGEENILMREVVNKSIVIQELLSHIQDGHVQDVAIFLPNGSEYISAFFAIIMLGMTAFPVNTLMTKHETIPLLEQASVDIVITSSKFRLLFEDMPVGKVIFVDELRECNPNAALQTIEMSIDTPMVMLSTSGTTGQSKIVQLSENNVETSVLGYVDKMESDETNIDNIKFIVETPFSSAYGMMILFACLIKSFPIVLLQETFTLTAFYKAVEKYRITHYEGGTLPIQMMAQMADRPIPYDISSLKRLGFGGSKISGQTIKNVMMAYDGMGLYQGYGMTEASPLIAKHKHTKLEKVDSVGTAIKGVGIAIEANGTITDNPFVKGEIIVKGSNMMLGYYKNEVETNKVIKNDYLYTGDIGYLDEEGYLYICGRKKNVIIVRGFNVHPEEVEDCILNSSLAKDCSVYGQIDDGGYEYICADIVPISSQVRVDDIMAYLDIHLAGYKQPRQIHICDAIKKNSAGKTSKPIKDFSNHGD